MSYTELHPRFIKTDPWADIDTKLNELIDKIVIGFTPGVESSDDLPDLLDDWDNRETAIEILIKKLQKMKGSE